MIRILRNLKIFEEMTKQGSTEQNQLDQDQEKFQDLKPDQEQEKFQNLAPEPTRTRENFKIFILGLNYNFWGKIIAMITIFGF